MRYSLDVIAEIITRDPDRGLFKEATGAIDPTVYTWQWGPKYGYGVINKGDSFALLEIPNIASNSLNNQQLSLMRKGWPRTANIPIVGKSQNAGDMIALAQELHTKHNIDLDEPWRQARKKPIEDAQTGEYAAGGGTEVWPSGMDYNEDDNRLGPQEAQLAERFSLTPQDVALVKFAAMATGDHSLKMVLPQYEKLNEIIANDTSYFTHAIEIMLKKNRRTVVVLLQRIPENSKAQMLKTVASNKSDTEPGKWGLTAQQSLVMTMYLISHPDVPRPKLNAKLNMPYGAIAYIKKTASNAGGFVRVIGQLAKNKGLGRTLSDMTSFEGGIIVRRGIVDSYMGEHWGDYVGAQ